MQTYTRLNQIPKEYYTDLPLNRLQAKQLLHENNKKKKDFSCDDDLKKYLTNKYIIKQIDNIIQYADDEEIQKYLIIKILSKLT